MFSAFAESLGSAGGTPRARKRKHRFRLKLKINRKKEKKTELLRRNLKAQRVPPVTPDISKMK